MNRYLRIAVFCLACGLGVAACASTAEVAAPETTTTTVAPQTTTTTTPTELAVVTTIRRVPAEELGSVGYVLIDEIEYEFAFECFAAGAGDVLALGVGEDPSTEASTQAIVQMFFGQPFVSVLIEDQQTLELAIDAPAELFLQDSVIRGSALRFVHANEDAGIGEPLGLGEVTVTCDSFAPGLPDEYATS